MDVTVGIPGGIMPPVEPWFKIGKKNEEMGYDSLWWPDHLMGWHPDSVWTKDITDMATTQKNPHLYLEPFTMMAAMGAHTSKIKIGLVVTDLIKRHPAVVAQTALTLDHITKGRVILGLGSGEKLNITPYGMDFSKPVSKLEEGLKIIKMLWDTTEPVFYEGKHWKLDGAVLGLEPYNNTPPPIWLAAHGPRMLSITGKYADGWIPTKMSVEEYKNSLDRIMESGKKAGRDMSQFVPGMLAYVITDESRDACEEMMEPTLVKGLCLLLPAEVFEKHGYQSPWEGEEGGFHGYIPTLYDRESALKVMNKVPKEMVKYYSYVGTPEEIAEELHEYIKVGLRHITLWNITPFADTKKTKTSFEGLVKIKNILHGMKI